MEEVRKSKSKWLPYVTLGIIWLIYLGFTMYAPVGEALTRYGLSMTQLQVLRITIAIPLLFIWFAALHGTVRLGVYARSITGSTEAKYYRYASYGLLTLLLGLIVPSFINFIQTYSANPDLLERTIRITTNYIGVAVSLIAFTFFFLSSRKFVKEIHSKASYVLPVLISIAISALYVYLVFQNEFRTISDNPEIMPTFYLNDVVIFSSILVPYAVSWILGVLAISGFYSYAKNVQGYIYKKAFRYVSIGLSLVIFMSAFLQIISQTGLFRGDTGLSLLLWIVYIFLFVIAIGYLYVARGAGALSRIENIN